MKLNLNQEQYYIPNDGHPNKQVWEIVTPKLIKELKKKYRHYRKINFIQKKRSLSPVLLLSFANPLMRGVR